MAYTESPIVGEIGKIKKMLGLPVYDPVREKRIFSRMKEANAGPLDDGAIIRMFERVVDESRRLERIMSQRGGVLRRVRDECGRPAVDDGQGRHVGEAAERVRGDHGGARRSPRSSRDCTSLPSRHGDQDRKGKGAG